MDPSPLAAPVEPASAPRPERRLSPAIAQLAGWIAVAIVNAAVIAATLPKPPGGWRVRAFHHLYDAAQLIGTGVAFAAAIAAWRRFAAPGRALGLAATAAASLAIAPFVLLEDFDGFATRVGGRHSGALLVASVVAGSMGIPFAAVVGRLVARRWLRIVGVGAGVAVAIVNHRVLWKNYPGVHFELAWIAATLIGSSLVGIRIGRAPTEASPRPRTAAMLAWAALAAVGAWGLATHPKSAVMGQLLELPGCAVAPFATRVDLFGAADPEVPTGAEEWFRNRRNAPEIPPSQPPLLGNEPVVVLITIDCLRADLLTNDAYARSLPQLVALRRTSAQFTNARSAAPATEVSLASMFASRYYSQLYWSRKPIAGRSVLLPSEDPSPRFPELLTASGVATANIAGTAGLMNDAGAVRGFADEVLLEKPNGPYATASVLADAAVERIRAHRSGAFFLYVHFLDAHAPYDRAGAQGSLFDRYVREVALVDRAVGRIVAELDATGVARRSAVFVTADHGEAFGEHHTYQHGVTVYDELMRVPLLARVAGVSARRIGDLVSLVDLGPTILDLFGRPTPGSYMGQSLLPLLGGDGRKPSRPIAVDSGRLMQAIVFPDGMKVIWHKREHFAELYDLARDPNEKVDVFDTDPDADRRLATLRAFFQAHALDRPGYRPPYRPP